jgi:hypothetical protein
MWGSGVQRGYSAERQDTSLVDEFDSSWDSCPRDVLPGSIDPAALDGDGIGLEGYAPPTVPDDGGLAQQRTERNFITHLLQFQVFDGHIEFTSWAMAEVFLGKKISGALRAIHATVVVTAKELWTAAVLVLLERDFQSCKALWELMAVKMASCVPEVAVLQLDLLYTVRKSLEGLELPVKKGAAANIAPTSSVVGHDLDSATRESDQMEGSASKCDGMAPVSSSAKRPKPGPAIAGSSA